MMRDPRTDTAEERERAERAIRPQFQIPAKAAAPDGPNRAQRRARDKALRRQQKHRRDR